MGRASLVMKHCKLIIASETRTGTVLKALKGKEDEGRLLASEVAS